MLHLKDYARVVGSKAINNILEEAKPLAGKHVVHVNSTSSGGGVAEILTSLVPLLNDSGIRTSWDVIVGSPDFFQATKSIHNALQGENVHFNGAKKRIYEKTNQLNASFMHISRHDCVIIHDPQPLPLIKFYRKGQPWIWRCHIDLTKPNASTWNYLKNFVLKYDATIVSKPTFKQHIPIPQEVIHPSIDPLSPKNKPISENIIRKYLNKFNISTHKPIISQISRFDKWKDPVGVIKAYELVKKKTDCQLVLLGSMASDDPEGQQMYDRISELAKYDQDIHVINYASDVLVNVMQRASSVVIQKSLKEGFGLTVSEALWKGIPVVAGNVGGIPLQVKHGYNGYLVNSPQTCAQAVTKLLKNPKLAKQMGKNGHEFVKEKFLITRHLLDYVHLLKKYVINYKTN
jgi:trehalose synthase